MRSRASAPVNSPMISRHRGVIEKSTWSVWQRLKANTAGSTSIAPGNSVEAATHSAREEHARIAGSRSSTVSLMSGTDAAALNACWQAFSSSTAGAGGGMVVPACSTSDVATGLALAAVGVALDC